MAAKTCSTCGSTMGFYDGPNGAKRCLNCFHDQDMPTASEAPPPEPNKAVEDKAEDGPKNVMTTAGTVQDKAERGPKEPTYTRPRQVQPSRSRGTAT